MSPRPVIPSLLLCLVHAAALAAQAPVPSIADAERRFAGDAAARGVPAAFLAVLHDTSFVFGPEGPIAARPAFEGRENHGFLLEWRPEFGLVSRSGDLGFTSGPWTLRQHVGDSALAGSGHYLSVWRRDGARGPWRLFLDLGVDHDTASAGEWQELSPAPSPAGRGRATEASLRAADAALAAAQAREGAAALLSVGAPELVLLRFGAPPARGLPAARELASRLEERGGGRLLGFRMARAADLGVTWGQRLDANGTGAGYYVRLWRAEGPGRWRLLVDLLRPPPPAGG